MKYLKYVGAYLVPTVVALSLYLGDYYSYMAIFILFGILPILELFTSTDTVNMTELEESIAKEDKIYDYILYGLVPCQLLVMLYFCSSSMDISWYTYII